MWVDFPAIVSHTKLVRYSSISVVEKAKIKAMKIARESTPTTVLGTAQVEPKKASATQYSLEEQPILPD
jgi:hypothetical protein